MELTATFWNNRYQEGSTSWDAGKITTPIKTYIDQLTDKNLKILIPGAGNAHEAAYAWSEGFTHIHVLDWSELAIANVRKRLPDLPADQLHQMDFFDMEGSFDLVLEQTFFCALDPSLRSNYVEKMASLIKQGGTLAGVMFDHPMYDNRPPYGGTIDEYRTLFSTKFHIKKLSSCYNSIGPRADTECFIVAIKK